ncbi:hypothetical protein N0V90_002339 [Kalmusia sp. IMI 367209]|nr:hypothetical protein N0V90_002339 [Kalmusia sp. IMI 367209]
MFQFSVYFLGALLAGQHDNKKERPPPSRPIPVTFPSLDPPEPSISTLPTSWTDHSAPGIAAHFLNLKKPSDVDVDTLALLNVSFQPQSDFETLLASVSTDAQAYIPPSSWLKAPEQNGSKLSEHSAKLLCNGRKAPDQNDFYVRAKELVFRNEDAFANLTRKPMGEKVPLRLAHFRKFWEGLDNMAYYWDNSLDEYLIPDSKQHNNSSIGDVVSDQVGEANDTDVPSAVSPTEEEPRKKAKTESETIEPHTVSTELVGSDASALPLNSPMSSSRVIPARTSPPKTPWEASISADKPVDLSKGSYTGYRIGNGADMPDSYRLEADTSFGTAGDIQAESVLDVVRELGGMLLLAQERARQGKTESRGGEGKWWTTTHRWGGGPGGEVGEATGASDAPSENHATKADEKLANRSRVGSKDRRRPTPAEIWKTLKPGNPLWDPKVVYEAIGKDPNVAWDDVFMISSLNHHISVLKLRVHPLYVQYLAEGTLPPHLPADPDWCSPRLQRTRWFDLFDTNDRTEAMRGLWGIMNYLMRAQETPDVPMKNT